MNYNGLRCNIYDLYLTGAWFRILAITLATVTGNFHGFPHFLKSNAGIIPQIMTRPVLDTSLQIIPLLHHNY